MFPRLSRLLRLALFVGPLALFLILLIGFGGDYHHHPKMVQMNEEFLAARRLSSSVRKPPSVHVPQTKTSLPNTRLNTTRTRQRNNTGSTMASSLTTAKEKEPINPHNFRYILNPETACHAEDGRRAQMVVYVHSAPANLKKRQSVRQTWGDKSVLERYNASLVFIMGIVHDLGLMQLIQMESERYGDIVQEDFVDSYHNLTYKGIAGLKWVSIYCPSAVYILKTDDDILVNIHRVVKYIDDVVKRQYGARRLVLCNSWTRMGIIRDKKSKWYVSETEFPGKFFPPYCSGSAFLLSGDMARLLYEASLVTPFFWVDDYYVTGALVKHWDVKHQRLNQAYSLNPGLAEEKFRNDAKHVLFFFHLHKLRVMYMLWKNMTTESASHKGFIPNVTKVPSITLA